MTMTLISTTTLTGSAASITLSSIPATFTDIKIVLSARTDWGTLIEGTLIGFNGSSSNFTAKDLLAYSVTSGALSGNFTTGRGGIINGNNATSNTFGNMTMYVPNYASATYKSYSIDSVPEHNGTIEYGMNIVAGLWSNTAAITSVTLTPDAGHNWVAGTTASIYGILKGSGGATVS